MFNLYIAFIQGVISRDGLFLPQLIIKGVDERLSHEYTA